MALGRQAQKKGYSGPTLGATENKREFTEEHLQATLAYRWAPTKEQRNLDKALERLNSI